MDDHAQRVDAVAVHEDGHLHQVAVAEAADDAVHRAAALRAVLHARFAVVDHFLERQLVDEAHAALADVLRLLVDPAALLAEVHDRPDAVGGRNEVHEDVRLADLLDVCRIRQLAGAVDAHERAIRHLDLVRDRRRRLDDLDVEFALQPLLDNLHVQQPEEAAAEAEAQRVRAFGLERKARVVELEAVHRVAELVVLRFAAGVEVAVDHLLDRLVAGQRFGGGVLRIGNGVADADVVQVFDGGDDEPDLAGPDARHAGWAGYELADSVELVLLVVAHEADLLTALLLRVDDADVRDDAAVIVVNAVEDQGPRRQVRFALWRGEFLAELGDELVDALAGLGRDEDRVFGREAEHLLDF